MAIYRIKQFYWSIISKIELSDKAFIQNYLNKEELNLFNKLPVYDRKHSINVAYDVKRICDKKDIKSNSLVKVALLHDIGKTCAKLTIIDKSILVILNKISKGKVKKFKKFKKIDIYYNHGDKGYDILKTYGYNERFLYLIKNHHNKGIIGDKELDILKFCDNKN